MITQSRLQEVVSYNPETGEFTRISKTGRKGIVGSKIGGKDANGYVLIGIDGRRYYAHRLAFIYMTGECPTLVDHIDQDRGNNAWGNIREADKSINAYNAKLRVTNASGSTGVSWHDGGQKWQAHCGSRYLGLFDTVENASTAYIAAKIEVVA